MRLVALYCLPKGEVASGVLVVLVEVDACAVLDIGEILFRELAVVGIAGEAEVPGAVFRLVGDVPGGELLDEVDHLGDALGGVRDNLGAFDREGVHVFEEGVLIDAGVIANGKVDGRGVADDLVVDVRHVHHVLGGDALLVEEAAEDVYVEECAEVADMAVVVDGGAAAVHAERRGVNGRKRLDGSAEGVEKIESCHVAFWVPLPQPRVRCSEGVCFGLILADGAWAPGLKPPLLGCFFTGLKPPLPPAFRSGGAGGWR